MQKDFPWGYNPVQHQQHPPMALPQHGAPAVGLMAPAAWGASPPAGVVGLGPPVYKNSPLGTHSELHLLEHGTELTFQDEMATLFTSDALLFSDTAGEEQHPPGIVDAKNVENKATDLVTAPLDMPGLGNLPGGLPPHPTQGINKPLVGGGGAAPVEGAEAPAPVVSSAAALAIALAGPPLTAQLTQSVGGGIPQAASRLPGAVDASKKLPEEVSGSGSGEASADGFALPRVSSEHVSASPIKSVLGSEVDLKRIVDEVEERSSEEDEDKIPSVLDQQQQQQQQHQHQHLHQQQQRLRLAASPLAVGGGATFAGRPTPISPSGHSGGRLSQQPSTSRGQISTESALGKRSAADLQLAEATKRGGTRKRTPSKRAVAAAFDASSDEEEEDAQYRNARTAYRNGGVNAAGGMGGAGGANGPPARTSTRLQGRPSGYRLDSDYVTYDDFEEPSAPGNGRMNGSGALKHRRVGSRGGTGRVTTPAVAAATASGRRVAPSRAGRRTVPLAAQRIRATSARHELKGRPSFAEIVEAGFMRPGPHRFNVGNVEVAAAVGEDGAIMYAGIRYRAISKFALVVLRERNPTRQSCDGWKEVAWNGEKLDALRVRVQAHARQIARQRITQ